MLSRLQFPNAADVKTLGPARYSGLRCHIRQLFMLSSGENLHFYYRNVRDVYNSV
jgi:hypothetical protein